jgi:trehalose 6-phosphate synthase/phosphatase
MARSLWSRAAWERARTVLRSRNGTLLIGLDLDGTIAPIVARPELARVPARTRRLLVRAARADRVRVVVVSARPLSVLRRLLAARSIGKIGQYGLEGPFAPPAAARVRFRATCREIEGELRRAVSAFPGALVEAKGLTVAVHERAVAPGRLGGLRRAVERVARDARRRGFHALPGVRAVDFVPRGFEKGGALRRAVARYRASAVFYFGDSGGDEPAFAALGKSDFPIRVGLGRTRAAYRVRDPRDVTRFLGEVIRHRGG